jgi:catechol 2,3-dioxygenase-like lactoylglutathione lyase family enzyme
MLAMLHVGRIGQGRRGNAHLRNLNRSAPMPNLENLRKQAKLILRWHRDRYFPVAAQIRSGLSRYAGMTDSDVLAQSFKLSDAQELVARQYGFQSWQALKTGLPTMSEHAQSVSAKAVITAAEPQLFVADIRASIAFFADKLGFAEAFTYGEPPFYAQVSRDGARINLRCVDRPVIDAELRDREQLLAAYLTVATADDIKALFLEYQAAGATFFQTLRREPWGARDFIVRDPDGNLLLFAGPADNDG